MSQSLSQNLIPTDAPFSTEQREWLNGFLTGILAPFSTTQEETGLPVTILWGSQTGTAEGLAKKFAKKAKTSGISPKVQDATEFDFSTLSSEEHLLIITSTYGDGEAPDNIQGFYTSLHADDAPSLAGVNYSILSIGDSSYPDFCQCGIDLDNRFKALGATCIAERIDCDLELDEDFANWTNNVISVLGEASSNEEEEEEEAGYTKKNPFNSKLLTNYNLNKPTSDKATHHLEFCLKESGLSYEAGDALGMYPVNDPELIEEFLEILPFDGTEKITEDENLKSSMLFTYEIKNLTIPVLKEWATRSASPDLLAIIEDKAAMADFMWGRDIIDLQKHYPLTFESPSDFLSVLKKLAPRLYSISSSPKAHPDEVHLTVGYVKYESQGSMRKGVCSSYLAERCTEEFPPRIFMHSNKAFRPPTQPDAPMIMVGPGTGIAPFRAFLEERFATQAKGENWLFFGNPHVATDFLYEEQLTDFQEKGYLHKLSLAFSRDQTEKVYVQDKIIENGEELFKWLENNGHFYVCGDASRMAKDVDTALHKIIEVHGNMSEEDAAEYVNTLKAERRYSRDVY